MPSGSGESSKSKNTATAREYQRHYFVSNTGHYSPEQERRCFLLHGGIQAAGATVAMDISANLTTVDDSKKKHEEASSYRALPATAAFATAGTSRPIHVSEANLRRAEMLLRQDDTSGPPHLWAE